MDKAKINYLIDVPLALSFVIVAITSLIIFFFLPSGVRQGSYQTFLGIAKFTWSKIHTISGLAMIALSLIHLILHFNWFICITKTFFKKKAKECKK